jgi:DNA sulfur modification protein DndE
MPLTTQILMRRYKSTEQAGDKLAELSSATGWRDDVISRLAIARSLREPRAPPRVKGARRGKELQGGTLFKWQDDTAVLPWFVALVAEHAGKRLETEEETYELIVAHWHRGLDLLKAGLEAGGVHGFVLNLARLAGEVLAPRGEAVPTATPAGPPSRGAGRVRALTVPIGRLSGTEDPFCVTLNDTRAHSNCHLAITGISGSGKTQMAKQIAGSALRRADPATGMIFIDYAKGDVAQDRSFVEEVGATVYHLPGTQLPVGPFHLRDYSPEAVALAAEEKREVYMNLFRNLGPKQQGMLAQAIRSSYNMLADDPLRAPDISFVAHVVRDLYDQNGLQPDSLTELFRRLSAYRLFWGRGDGSPPATPLHSQRWVVDIHELGGLKEVTAFTLIEQLYREMRGLPESEVDPATGMRQVRCLLFIDEAQYYLKSKNRFLQGIIREGRSKGFAVALMSQSPDDFDQPDFDYTEQLEFTYMLSCKTKPKAVQRVLGVDSSEAKALAAELGRLAPLHGVGRRGGRTSPIESFRAIPFYEMAHR